MRLKTKLVLTATGVTFAMVLLLSAIFLAELLRQRIAQTTADNEVLAHEVLLMTRQSIETGLEAGPASPDTDQAFNAAVTHTLRDSAPLADTMNAIIRYSPTVQDVSVSNAGGVTLVSTNPDAIDQQAPARTDLGAVRDGSFLYQVRQMFGTPHVLDIAIPLDRNGRVLVVVRLGVRSSFLRAAYVPWLHQGLWFVLVATLGAMAAAALLASAALKPINRISERLDRLTQRAEAAIPLEASPTEPDAVVRVTRTIDLLGRQMRSTEAEYTLLQTNLTQILDTLRDGILLFTAEGRAAMVSDAVAHFVSRPHEQLGGKRVEEVFVPTTVLGAAVRRAFAAPHPIAAETVVLENGRRIQLSVDRVHDGRGRAQMGTLVTLRDIESAIQLEQELEVSRRLIAIGRLTAGVGHEVKNPINAMVLHLELLRGKLAGDEKFKTAKRHVDILAGEMQRLDRVVQTLADFTRPMEPKLAEHDLRDLVRSVMELTGEEMRQHRVRTDFQFTALPVSVHVDADLMRQALLNLLLNAMQAMPCGGIVHITVRREGWCGIVEVLDEGEGIRAELLPRIFELYFTTKESGSGIGLATTYRILQLHGGSVEVQSNTSVDDQSMPRGTNFSLSLPLLEERTDGRNGRGLR